MDHSIVEKISKNVNKDSYYGVRSIEPFDAITDSLQVGWDQVVWLCKIEQSNFTDFSCNRMMRTATLLVKWESNRSSVFSTVLNCCI